MSGNEQAPDGRVTDLDQALKLILEFLDSIGLEVRRANIEGKTFLPGITIESGVLLYDESKLLYPGDLLHEAGHLAVMPSERRARASGDVGKRAGEEMAAIAWSYAAALHIGIDPAIVFHEHGYSVRGGAFIVENFSKRRYIGVPILQWLGMAADNEQVRDLGMEPYPKIIRWLAP